MPDHPQHPGLSPHTSDDISLEPQIQELERMSEKLRRNLGGMIAEQRDRVEKFAQSKLSLSALPEQPVLPEIPALQASFPQADAPGTTATATTGKHAAVPPPLYTGSRKKQQAKQRKHPAPQTIVDWNTEQPPVPTEQPPRPAANRAPQRKTTRDSNDSDSSGWLIAVGIFFFVIVMRSCG